MYFLYYLRNVLCLLSLEMYFVNDRKGKESSEYKAKSGIAHNHARCTLVLHYKDPGTMK